MAEIAEANNGIESIISCLASRSGIKKDAYAIDYQATLNCLEAGRDTSVKARHFVLLSAFCVKNPWLQFQQAKLKFEDALTSQNDMSYSIVRPTAFFKSVSGQLEVIQSGAPFVMFGDGEVTRCNPISEADLSTYLIDSITDKTRENKIIDLGGPDEPLTMKKQGEMLYEAVGKKPNFFYAPLWLFDSIIDSLQWVSDTFNSEKFENAAELGRIGKYYAVEDMLTTKPEEKFGTMTLMEHYQKIAVEGQEVSFNNVHAFVLDLGHYVFLNSYACTFFRSVRRIYNHVRQSPSKGRRKRGCRSINKYKERKHLVRLCTSNLSPQIIKFSFMIQVLL